jgi:hypothetical protein
MRPRSLTARQERLVFRWINGKDPRQCGLDFGLWTRSVLLRRMMRHRLAPMQLGACLGCHAPSAEGGFSRQLDYFGSCPTGTSRHSSDPDWNRIVPQTINRLLWPVRGSMIFVCTAPHNQHERSWRSHPESRFQPHTLAQSVVHLENHDLVDADRDKPWEIQPRIAQLAYWDHPREWFGRSRSRVATGILVTGPGTPMMFMGQEFLESKSLTRID